MRSRQGAARHGAAVCHNGRVLWKKSSHSGGAPRAVTAFLTRQLPEAVVPVGFVGDVVYLSDGYPQATAMKVAALAIRKVYLSDGYPQATAWQVVVRAGVQCI